MHRFHFWRTREMDRARGEKREKKRQAREKEWKRNLGRRRRWWRRPNRVGDEGKEEGEGDAVRERIAVWAWKHGTPWDRTHASRPAQRVAVCVLLFSLLVLSFSPAVPHSSDRSLSLSFFFSRSLARSLASQLSVRCQSVNSSFCLRPRLPRSLPPPRFGPEFRRLL